MQPELTCSTCGSHDISKNGTTRRGKQNYKCRDCGRQFVEDPQWKPKDRDTLGPINLLLLEQIPLAGIVRATGVSESWLQGHVNDRYATVPQTVTVWLAMDADTREIIGCPLVIAPGTQPGRYGSHCPASTDNVPRSIPITGMLTKG